MKRLVWLLRRHAAALSLAAGALLVAAALGLHWRVVRPLAQQVQALQAATPGPRAGALDRMGEALAGPETARARLDRFYRHFARDERLTERLARVDAIANKLGLEIKRADYRLDSQPGRRLDRYQMTVPMQGSYTAIRAFVGAVLRDLPTVSLEQIQFQRKDVAEGKVDTQISFIFHLAR
jgi:hypothetical protein